MKRFSIFFTFFLTLFLTAGSLQGPFRWEAGVWYFLHDGSGPCRAGVTVHGKNTAAVIRIYDTSGNLVHWRYLPVDSSVQAEYRFPREQKAGIFQIRVSGVNIRIQPWSMPGKPTACMPLRFPLRSETPEQFLNTRLYFRIPAGKRTVLWEYKNVNFTIRNQNDTPVKTAKKMPLDLKEPQVWSLEFKTFPAKWESYLWIDSFPAIFASDPETASAAAERKQFPHLFQEGLQKYLSTFRKEDLAMDPAFPQEYLSRLRDHPASWCIIGKNGPFRYVPYVIASQNLNEKSPSFGDCASPELLALAWSHQAPWNPWYHHPVLEKRLLLWSFRQLLKLRENDTFYTDGGEVWSHRDIEIEAKLARVYALIAPQMKDRRLAELWGNGVRRCADRFAMARHAAGYRLAQWPGILLDLAQGSGEKGYLRMAEDLLKLLCLGENRDSMHAGYIRDHGGPDAEQNARVLSELALFFRRTQSRTAWAGITKLYALMEHTVAPGPDGKQYGCTGFNHRTARSWADPDLRAGESLLRGVLPAAARRDAARPKLDKRVSLQKIPVQTARSKEWDAAANNTLLPDAPFCTEVLYPSRPLADHGSLPARENMPFLRNFNREFLAVRKQNYYAFFYTGKTIRDYDHYEFPKSDKPLPKHASWTPVQGLQLLAFPSSGEMLLSRNSQAAGGNFLRAGYRKKEIWPDYGSFESAMKGKFLAFRGGMRNEKNLKFIRRTAFLADGIAQELVLENARAVRTDSLYEQIAYLKTAGTPPPQYLRNGVWTKEPGKCTAVRIGRLLIRLDSPHVCRPGPETRSGNVCTGTLQIHLEPVLPAGQGARLVWSVTEIPEAQK